MLLSEEEQIFSSKYTARPRPRLFDEERFVFPESYGANRLRLLVKDPQWLFAYWDVAPTLLASWRAEIGERAMALSRLTLRIHDPGHADDQVILLPIGARSSYIRAEHAPRAYSAEIGLMLPSGEFRSIAVSHPVDTPRTGPSPEVATRTVPYDRIQAELVGQPTRPGPSGPQVRPVAEGSMPGKRPVQKGGASDVFRR